MAFFANEIMHSPKDILTANLTDEFAVFNHRYTAPAALDKLFCYSNNVCIAAYSVNFSGHKLAYSASYLFLVVGFIQNASKAIDFRHHTH